MTISKTHKLYCAREVFKKEKAMLELAINVIDTYDSGVAPDADQFDKTYSVLAIEYYRTQIVAELMKQIAATQEQPQPEPTQPVE